MSAPAGTTAASVLRPQGRRRGPMLVGLVLAVLGALAVAAGITAATVWTVPTTVTSTAALDGSRVAVTVPGLLEAREGTVTVRAAGRGEVTVATARSQDLKAWLNADPPVRAATVGAAGLPPEGAVAVQGARAAAAAPAADPATSDLWLSRASGSGGAELEVPRRAGPVQVIASAADGSLVRLSMTWPSTAANPLALPLLIGGAAVLLVGLLLMALWRRGSAGTAAVAPVPRRSAPEDLPAQDGPVADPAPSRGARSGAGRGRRVALALPLVGAVALAGCTSSAPLAPQPRAQQGPRPALTASQLQRVVEGEAGVVEVVDRADRALDADRAGQRLGGAALQAREAAYTVAKAARGAQGGDPATAPSVRSLGGARLLEAVPAATAWPRTVVIIGDPATTGADGEEPATDGAESGVVAPTGARAPVLTVLVQESPREPYKVLARANLLPGSTFPPLTQRDAAVQAVPAAADDSGGLVSSPRQVLADYADVLTRGKASDHYAGFAEGAFTDTVLAEQQQQDQASGRFADFSVQHTPRKDVLWSLRTADGGAVVVGVIDAVRTLAANAEGVTLNASPEVAALGGAPTSTEQTVTTAETVAVVIPPATPTRAPGSGADASELKVIGAERDFTAVELG